MNSKNWRTTKRLDCFVGSVFHDRQLSSNVPVWALWQTKLNEFTEHSLSVIFLFDHYGIYQSFKIYNTSQKQSCLANNIWMTPEHLFQPQSHLFELISFLSFVLNVVVVCNEHVVEYFNIGFLFSSCVKFLAAFFRLCLFMNQTTANSLNFHSFNLNQLNFFSLLSSPTDVSDFLFFIICIRKQSIPFMYTHLKYYLGVKLIPIVRLYIEFESIRNLTIAKFPS